MVSLPPEAMASRALTARFMMTCSICPASARTDQRFGPGTMTRSMSSPIMRVSILMFSVATSFRLTILGASICLRLKASSWRVKRRGAFGGAGDLLGRTAQMGLGPEAFEEKFRVAGNHHQQVVEVVRDAAGETAHGFHLLGLAKLLLEGAAFGDVLGKQFEDDAFRPRRWSPSGRRCEPRW